MKKKNNHEYLCTNHFRTMIKATKTMYFVFIINEYHYFSFCVCIVICVYKLL